MATIERLYELYNIISDAGADGSKHEAEYKEILSGTKSGSAERRLSSQFIVKYFTQFPNLQDEAVNGVFDLCEDDDISVRKQGIKDLPLLCKVKPDIIPKVADILAQLFQMEDPNEIITIQNALFAIIKMDPKGTLTGIFYQIENSMDEQISERCLRFLHSKIRVLVTEVFNSECEELVLRETKVGLKREISEEEFVLLMGILKELKLSKNIKGYQQLVDIVAEQCSFSKSVDVSDIDHVHRLASCIKQAIPFFSSQIRSTNFFEYLCKELIPVIPQIDEQDCASLALDLLRTTAEMIPHVGVVENIEEKLTAIFSLLLEVMPLPPENEDTSESQDSEVSLEFSRVECLLYIFHQLAKHHTEFLTDNPERLKDFRTRLQYFARGSQAYQKKLRETLSSKKGDELKTEENRIKFIALKTTANINTLIKDLFHTPPSYKSTITFPWKEPSTPGPEKRHTPITFEGSPTKTSKSDREIYAPPRDKYSRSAGQFFPRGRGRGRGGRRNFRRFGRY